LILSIEEEPTTNLDIETDAKDSSSNDNIDYVPIEEKEGNEKQFDLPIAEEPIKIQDIHETQYSSSLESSVAKSPQKSFSDEESSDNRSDYRQADENRSIDENTSNHSEDIEQSSSSEIEPASKNSQEFDASIIDSENNESLTYEEVLYSKKWSPMMKKDSECCLIYSAYYDTRRNFVGNFYNKFLRFSSKIF
jgi:hypothetical protein